MTPRILAGMGDRPATPGCGTSTWITTLCTLAVFLLVGGPRAAQAGCGSSALWHHDMPAPEAALLEALGPGGSPAHGVDGMPHHQAPGKCPGGVCSSAPKAPMTPVVPPAPQTHQWPLWVQNADLSRLHSAALAHDDSNLYAPPAAPLFDRPPRV